jgi:serine/threonine protein kinase
MQISVCCDKLVTAEKKVPTSYGSPNEGVTFTRISRDQNSSPSRTPTRLLLFIPKTRRRRCERRVPLEAIVRYVTDVAPALQYVHDQGLVNRDLRPENLLLGKHEQVLLSVLASPYWFPDRIRCLFRKCMAP